MKTLVRAPIFPLFFTGLMTFGVTVPGFASPTLTVGSAAGAAGTTVSVPVNFSAGTTGTSSLQFTMAVPAGWTFVSASTGSAASLANKSVEMNPANGTVIVFGVNQNIVETGVVATLEIRIAANAPAGSTPVTLTQVVDSDPNGLSVPPGPSQAGVIVVDSALTAPGSANPIPQDLSSVRVYPNPWRSDKNAAFPWVKFDSLPSGSTVKIFTLSGHRIKTLSTDDNGTALWDRTNDTGDVIGSGLYIYLIKDSKGNKLTGKMAVIQ